MRTTRATARALQTILLCVGLAARLTASWAAEDRLAAEIEAALADKRLAGAKVGVCVVTADSAQVSYRRCAMEPLIPASNQKLIAAAAALRGLGLDYEFKTSLLAAGEVDRRRGALRGDLIFQGGGDPTFGSPTMGERPLAQFERWADVLREQGVQCITGDLVLDDSFFDREHVHPDWPRDQLWRHYCAPVGALALQDNCVLVGVKPNKGAGQKAVVTLSPPCALLSATVECKTSTKRHVIRFDRKPGSALVQVDGFVRANTAGYQGLVSVPDPAMFAGEAFAEVLKDKGVRLEGKVRLVTAEDIPRRKGWRSLAVRRTPLRDVLRVMLRESQNMYAEAVIKTVGAELEGEGSWKAGLRRVGKMLEQIHFRADEFTLADGSGMSRNNRVPPGLLCVLMLEMAREQYGGALEQLLAAPGDSGTLENRFKDPAYADRLRAKTGYLSGVGALSGYAKTKSGREVTFSILINDFHSREGNWAMKQIEDRIARAVVDHAQ